MFHKTLQSDVCCAVSRCGRWHTVLQIALFLVVLVAGTARATRRMHVSMHALEYDECKCNSALTRDALSVLYESTGGGHWSNSLGWLIPESTVCTWYGVTCSNLTLLKLTLSNNNLSGQLPNNVWPSLASLESLDLTNNTLRGTLPPQLRHLSKLKVLLLQDNRIYGTLPREYQAWRNLVHFEADGNMLTGTLPPEYASWTSLQRFGVMRNMLTGTLPAQYSAWGSIGRFQCSANALVGTLPDEYRHWSKIGTFYVDRNRLNGTLPISYWEWSTIREFVVYSNQFHGPLPYKYKNWTLLETFYVNLNMFSGTLPPEYANWLSLTDFFVASCKMSGTLPPEYGIGFKKLKSFVAGNNRFTGPVPTSYTKMASLEVFSIQYNSIDGVLPLIKPKVALIVNHNFNLMIPSNFSMSTLIVSACSTRSNWCNTPFVAVLGYFCGPLEIHEPLTEESKLTTLNLSAHRAHCGASTGSPTTPPDTSLNAVSVAVMRSAAWRTNAVAVAALSSLLAGSSSAALSSQRLALRVVCTDTADPLPPSISEVQSPLALRFGAPSAAVAAHVGAIVGNLVVCIAAVILAGGAVAWRVYHPTTPHMPRRAARQVWYDAASTLRLPGGITLPVSWMYQQVVLSSVVCLSSTTHEKSTVQVAVGVVGATCSLVWVMSLLATLVLYFAATASESPLAAECSNDPKWKAVLRWAAAPSVQWVSRDRTYVAAYGMLFTGCCARRQWWLLGDVLVTSCLGVLTGLSSKPCIARRWASVAVSGVWLVATVALRPKCRRLTQSSAICGNLAAVVVALCVALEVPDAVPDAVGLTASVYSSVVSITVFASRWLLSPQRVGQSVSKASEKESGGIRRKVVRKKEGYSDLPTLAVPTTNVAHVDEELVLPALKTLVEAACNSHKMHASRYL